MIVGEVDYIRREWKTLQVGLCHFQSGGFALSFLFLVIHPCPFPTHFPSIWNRTFFIPSCKNRAGIPATLHEYRAALFEKPIVNIRKRILGASQSFLFQSFGIWTFWHLGISSQRLRKITTQIKTSFWQLFEFYRHQWKNMTNCRTCRRSQSLPGALAIEKICAQSTSTSAICASSFLQRFL